MWLRTSDRPAVRPAPPLGGQPRAWRQAFQFGPLITAVVYAAGTLGGAVKPPVLAIIVICSALAGGLVIAAVLAAGSVWSAAYASGCGIAAAGWLAFAFKSHPVSWPAAVAAVVPAAALIALYPVMRAREHRAAQDARRAAEEAALAREQRKWPDLIARIGHQGVRFAGQEATLAGYKVHLRLPGSGRVTYSGLAPATEQLEVAARLRHGSLRFERGDQAHKVILHVAERDVLAETVPLPAEHGTLSITRPVPLGLFEDGQVCAVTLREVATLIVGLRGSGKALALDTPVPTPGGWTTMGEIQAGDIVYDEAGVPCQVTDAWDIRYGRPCYEVEFSDGSTIVADGEHQWLVDTDASRRPVLPEVVTTEAMIGSLRAPRRSGVTADGAVNNYSIRVAAPLQAADAALLVPPYTLGAWLGHGWSATGAITTADAEILTEIEDEGETVWIMPSTIKRSSPRPWTQRECRIGGLTARLRQIRVLDSKHIPTAYLRASETQRRALLAGLLDTDGYCGKHGNVEFCSTSRRLARDVRHLVATLGYRPSLCGKPAHLYGRDCGTAWTVTFATPDKVFRLPREAARQITSERSTARHRYILAIRPAPSVPVRCIAVDSPSHLYLVGESCIPTHNSNLLNVLLAQLARCPDVLIFAIDLKGGRMAAPWIEPWLAERTPRPVVDWLATDREEAERMLRALLRAVGARSRSGSGGEKIVPSPRQPAILLVCDEIAVILGIGTGGPRTSLDGVTNATLAGMATQLVMTGRSEAIDLIMATQRGTVTMTGSADLKSQCALRIGLGVASEADARLIIPDDVRIAADLARLRHPGTGIVQQGKDGRVMPAKFYRIEHEAISQIAERCGQIRPGPDKLLEDALGEDYATRWQPHRVARIPGVGSRPMVPAVIATPYQGTDEPRAAPATGLGRGAGPGATQDDGDLARRQMVVMLKSAGVRGMTIRAIAAQLSADGRETAEQTIHRWLTEEAAAGRAESASYGRWKWRDDAPAE